MYFTVGDKPYVQLGGISTTSATPIASFLDNTRKCIKKAKYKRIQDLPTFGCRQNQPIGLVGGGPSLKNPHILKELKQFYSANMTVACGSSHDWMVENGMPPNICVVADPDPVSANYLRRHSGYTKYFLASSSDQKVFDILKNESVYIWHNWSDEEDYIKNLSVIDPNYTFCIGGGCTVGLRALCIALFMGYSDIHFFGFDSCLGEDDVRYSYPLSTDGECMGHIYTIRMGMGTPHTKAYRCEGYHLAQAVHFKDFYETHNDKFTPVFHGDGLIKELVDIVHREAIKIEKEELELKYERI